jgi:GT2 family glycosyltransferase/glycosyltransferase involved in cell wall biosynthesis
MKKCDIIVPIYNAYDCVKLCVETVIKNTDLTNNGLILINDKSADDRIIPLLEDFVSKNPKLNITFLNNDINLGFVGTVNRGMKYSKNDVLLLNSDTEVPSNWLDKIKRCAYKFPNVATVTPLSNNATLASVPEIFTPNLLPNNMTLDEYDKLIEKCSYNEYPELPTGHGFCLYIRREALDTVGYFDEEAFGKGYGEENDFCFRCLDYGYRHLLCDDTVIFHKESQSFSESKYKLMENGKRKLDERYPTYQKRLDLWCTSRCIKHIGQNIKYNLNNNDHPNILFVIHEWATIEQGFGGTSLHAHDIIQKLRNKYNFYVLTPEAGAYKLYIYFEKEMMSIRLDSVNSINLLGIYNQDYRKMIERVIDTFGIGLIHIQHMIGHYFDILDIALDKKIKSLMTIHDLYPFCPTINKLYMRSCYCENCDKDCAKCVKYYYGADNNFIPSWNKNWRHFLSEQDKIFVPSEFVKSEVNRVYGQETVLIEHGEDLEKILSTKLSKKEEYNVAFVGALAPHKGSKILNELRSKFANTNIKLHLFGTLINPNEVPGNKGYINHGKYNRTDLPKILKENSIDLVCLLSVCPESYSYTLTETVAAGVPVLTFNIGALGERVSKNKLGWVIPFDSTTSIIADKIRGILSDGKAYNKVLKSIDEYEVKTIDQMAKEYAKFYKVNVIKREVNSEEIKKIIKENDKRNDSFAAMEASWILNSLRWRLISKIKVPAFVGKVIRKLRNR